MFTAGLGSTTNTYGLSGRALRVCITITAVTSFSLFGYDQGLMSGLITGEKFNEDFPATSGSSQHATVIQGAVTSCYEIGCFFGALFAMFAGAKTGRRPLILAGASLIIIGTIINVTCFTDEWGLGQFVIGRVVTGVGNGLNTATVPVWQSEMSKAHNRGFLVNLEGSVIAFGTLIAYWIDYGFSYIDSSVQWRFPVAFQIVFAAVVLVGAWGMPESPRWLIQKKRMEEAHTVLGALNDVSPTDQLVADESKIIVDGIERVGKQASFGELFTGGKTQHLRRMLIGCSGQFFQQWTGCNAAIYYSTVLFEKFLGKGHSFSMILGGIFSIIYALATIPSFFMVERVGRRNLFLIGAVGQGVSFLITFACLVKPTESNAKGAAVGLYMFIVFFAFTILPMPWIYPPEINPMKTRAAASAVSTCTNWISNFAVVMFTPIFINTSQWGCYLFFCVMNFLFVPIIFFFYPETAGRSLEEVDIIFAKAHVENKFVWRVAQNLPKLNPEEIEREGESLGLYDPAEKPVEEKYGSTSEDENKSATGNEVPGNSSTNEESV